MASCSISSPLASIRTLTSACFASTPAMKRAADLERQRAFARPVETGAAEHGLGERMDAVEVDLRRGQRSIEPRRPVLAAHA